MLNEGEVAITLDGKEYTLVPTLRAMRALSRHAGGMRGLLTAIVQQDFDAASAVVVHGTGRNDREALETALYRSGLTDATLMPMLQYVENLMNGGKPARPPSGDEAKAEAGNA